MIDRYTSPKMKAFWQDSFKFEQYLKVELANLQALRDKGFITDKAWNTLKQATFDLATIDQLETSLQHDVLAFVEACRQSLPSEQRWFHFGLTSSDVIDTAHGLILKSINEYLLQLMNQLADTLKIKAYEYQHTPIMARTHGMYAEPTVYGLRYALWFDDLKRLKASFLAAREQIEIIKLSGSVGHYPILPPDHEATVAKILGLKTTAIHTQVIQRDRHASYIFSLTNLTGLIEKIALDIRLLSRSEVAEVAEPFGAKQKGSSAMPHKRNPITSENLMGLARLMRGYLQATLENQSLWHERDISHSSVERVVMMDATTLIETMVTKITHLLNNLIVDPEQMASHLRASHDTYWTQMILSDAILAGMDREPVYLALQQHATTAIRQSISMLTLVKADPLFSKLNMKAWENHQRFYQHIPTIYQRIFG
jgi:adenylosuccinate lyase